MSLNISSEVSLKFSGKDAFSFVDSLISNSISESETKFSYLLGPDGKVMFWFICSLNNQEFQMYQSSDCLLYTSPSPRDKRQSRMPSSA